MQQPLLFVSFSHSRAACKFYTWLLLMSRNYHFRGRDFTGVLTFCNSKLPVDAKKLLMRSYPKSQLNLDPTPIYFYSDEQEKQEA
jgi:hypothetical protein